MDARRATSRALSGRRPAAAACLLLAGCARSCDGLPSASRAFSIAAPYEVTSLDPHVENSVSNFAVLSNVYEPLVSTDRDMRVQPALAGSWESPDPLTWVFRLRQGVSFHSGRPLTSRDVVYTLDRLRTDSAMDMGSFLHDIAGAEALDEHTVRVHTRRPVRVLLAKMHFALVVPEGATTESLERAPDGTGPYRVSRWERSRMLELERNERYHLPGLPAPRRVTFHQTVSPPAAAEALASGDHALVQGKTRDFERRAREDERYEALLHDNIYVKFLSFDLARAQTPYVPGVPNPFLRPEVREAIDLALDREALVTSLSSSAAPSGQPVPRFILGFDPSLSPARPDLARARVLMAEAGLAEGFEVTLHARRILEDPARLVAEQLARIGIRVAVYVMSERDFFSEHEARRTSFWISRYGCPSGDASDFLDGVAHAHDAERGYGQANYSGFADADFDRRIEESMEIERVDLRRTALQALVREVATRRIVIPLYVDQDVYALDRRYAWHPRNDSYLRLLEIRPR